MLEGKGANRGSVLKARCHCKGGHDGGCKHVAPLMYSLEDLLNMHDDDSFTPTHQAVRPTSRSYNHGIISLGQDKQSRCTS